MTKKSTTLRSTKMKTPWTSMWTSKVPRLHHRRRTVEGKAKQKVERDPLGAGQRRETPRARGGAVRRHGAGGQQRGNDGGEEEPVRSEDESACHRIAGADHGGVRRKVARPAGIEPATLGFGGQYSIP